MRWLLTLLLATSACMKPKPVPLYGPVRNVTADNYNRVLSEWTREDRVYDMLDTKMFVTATFHTPEFRRAFAVAFPEIYGHGGKITRRELVDLTGDVEQFHNFFLSVFTADSDWNDLDAPDSIWHINLIGSDEVAVDPAEILPVKIDANIRAVYPHITSYDKGYIVRFPLTDAMRRLVLDTSSTHATLRIASALGVAELRWDLLPTSDRRTEPPLAAR